MQKRAVSAVIILLLTLGCTWPTPGWAYHPHPGDRAADFAGRDIVNGGTVHLEDFQGRWLLLEFWSAH